MAVFGWHAETHLITDPDGRTVCVCSCLLCQNTLADRCICPQCDYSERGTDAHHATSDHRP